MVKINVLKKIKENQDVKMIICECLVFLLGFFFTPMRFAMGVYPFGIALLSASTKYTIFAYAGSLSSIFIFMKGDLVYVIGLSALLILRVIASLIKKPDTKLPLLGERTSTHLFEGFFEENVRTRIFISLATAFGIGLYHVIVNGYDFFDIFSLFFFTAVAPILTYGFSGAFEGKHTRAYQIASCTFIFAIIYLIREREIGGIDLSVVLSYLIILYVSKNVSGGASAIVGALLGICGNIAFAPIYAIAGIVGALIFKLSSALAITLSFVLVMGYAIFSSGYEAIAYLLPEILGASLIAYPILKFEIIPRPSFLTKKDATKSVSEIVLQRQDEKTKNDLKNMSLSFEEISKMLYETSSKTKNPTRKALEKSSFEIAEGYCYTCPKNEICWKRDVSTTKANILKMSDEAFIKSEIDLHALEEKFIHRCPNVEKITADIERCLKNMTIDSVKNDRLSISASNFELTSKMLDSLLVLSDENEEENLRYTDIASRIASSLGLYYEKIEVKGGAKKHIIATGVDPKRSSCSQEELCSYLEAELKIPLEAPILTEEDGIYTLEINGLASYKTQSALKSVSFGKEPNGDSISTFKGRNDKEYFLICDGMGTGDEAHLTSEMCTTFLEKILKVSSEKEVALSILNNFVRSKSVECSSSIDLLEIDLIGKGASFIKSGASPSFIKRGDKVFKLMSKTAPIGIMRNLDAEKLSFTFEHGDICVMLSDGIASGKGDSSWLCDYLKETEEKSTENIANEILSLAKHHAKTRDDMSVIVIVFE